MAGHGERSLEPAAIGRRAGRREDGYFPFWGAIAIPAGALWGPVLGAAAGAALGNVMIGAAIGAGLGIGIGLAVFAAAIVVASASV
jgi:hypothetical protein